MVSAESMWWLAWMRLGEHSRLWMYSLVGVGRLRGCQVVSYNSTIS